MGSLLDWERTENELDQRYGEHLDIDVIDFG